MVKRTASERERGCCFCDETNIFLLDLHEKYKNAKNNVDKRHPKVYSEDRKQRKEQCHANSICSRKFFIHP